MLETTLYYKDAMLTPTVQYRKQFIFSLKKKFTYILFLKNFRLIQDYYNLHDGRWLNDQCIDFYLEYVKKKKFFFLLFI